MLEVTSQLPVKPEELAPLPSPIPHTWPPGSSLTILIQKGGEGKAGEAWEHGPVPSPAVACLEERAPNRRGWALYRAATVSLLSPDDDLGQIPSPPGTRDSREGKKGPVLMALPPTGATGLSPA